MADRLCEEIIINVLQRLPIKILLRCTAVCKSWYSLITTPQFISSHLHFAVSGGNKSPFLFIRRCLENSERYDFILDNNDSITPHSSLEFPFRSINPFFTIVGACNGLICLSDDRMYYTPTIILWNPLLKKSVLLPKPDPIHNFCGTFSQSLGFGFDLISTDYKVVRIAYADHISVRRPLVELYELSTHEWRDLSFLALDHVIYSKSRSAYVNGATHWVTRHVDSYDLVLSFHMSNEVFSEVLLPCSLTDDDLAVVKDLLVLNDSLALILSSMSSFCVWVMKEYGVRESWSKHLSFDLRSLGERLVRPLWVRKGGGILAVLEDGRLICCNLGEGKEKDEEIIKDIGVGRSRSEDYRRSIHVDSHVESLVLLEKGILTSAKLSTLKVMEIDWGKRG
ncbi:F-box and associated interaction domains-containing protein [Striga asiatica]|uniref:F-box and associated interaction domains-containing protein n=1 Tax=Striga asiatica TaxID=4170 RepID=A0A5A7RGY4_STRAF|nr:F-box and associated interaction domains-containing protein [Striga asiatica]